MLNRLIISFLLLLPACGIYPQAPETLLRINPDVHTENIYRISTDSQGKYLLTASGDKTAKLWDIASGNLLRVFRPPGGPGQDGELHAAALSPDGLIAAVAGPSGTASIDPDELDINLLNITANNKITRYSIYIFSTGSGNMLLNIDWVGVDILDLRFSPDGKRLVAALSGDRGLLIFDAPDFSGNRRITGFSESVRKIDFSKSGDMAVIADDGTVRLFDTDFNIKRTKLLKGKPSDLSFSPDGRELAIAFADNTVLTILEVNTFEGKQYPLITPLTDKNSLFSSIVYASDGSIYTGGYYFDENSYKIRIWKQGEKNKDIPVSKGAINNLLPLPDGSIIFSSINLELGRISAENSNQKAKSPENREIKMIQSGINIFTPEKNRYLQTNFDGSEVGYMIHGQGVIFFSVNERRLFEGESSYKTATDRNAKYGIQVSRWKNNQLPYLNSIAMPVFEKDETGVCIDVAEDGKTIILGTAKNIYALDRHGGLLWRRVVPSGATAVKISGNGKIAVATLGNGTVIWLKTKEGEQLMTLYPHHDNLKWILWTPDGIYDCTASAENLAGWHINRGKHVTAWFFPLSRFRDICYRPDIIDYMISDNSEAKKMIESVKKQFDNIINFLPPVVSIVSPEIEGYIESSKIKLIFNVLSFNSESDISAEILLDGRHLKTIDKITQGKNEVEVEIPPRDCYLSLIAKNQYGTGVSETIILKGKNLQEKKQKLNVLSIGVSKYQNPALRLQHPAKDAVDFSNAIKIQAKNGYKDITVKTFIDEQVTENTFISGFEWLKTETTEGNATMIFMAGRAMNFGNVHYFLPVEADKEDFRLKGINFEDIRQIISEVKGQVFMFLDLCYTFDYDIDGLANKFSDPETGAVVFIASTGRRFASENRERSNSAFTTALIEGLSGKELTENKNITVENLSEYIKKRVKSLTNSNRKPAVAIPLNIDIRIF